MYVNSWDLIIRPRNIKRRVTFYFRSSKTFPHGIDVVDVIGLGNLILGCMGSARRKTIDDVLKQLRAHKRTSVLTRRTCVFLFELKTFAGETTRHNRGSRPTNCCFFYYFRLSLLC